MMLRSVFGDILKSLVSKRFYSQVVSKSAADTACHLFVLLVAFELFRAILFIYVNQRELLSLSVRDCASQFASSFPDDFEVLYDGVANSFQLTKSLTVPLPTCVTAGVSFGIQWFSHGGLSKDEVWQVFDPHLRFDDGVTDANDASSTQDLTTQAIPFVVVSASQVEITGFIPVPVEWVVKTFCEPMSSSSMSSTGTLTSTCNRHSLTTWSNRFVESWHGTLYHKLLSMSGIAVLSVMVRLLGIIDVMIVALVVFLVNLLLGQFRRAERVLRRPLEAGDNRAIPSSTLWNCIRFTVYSSSPDAESMSFYFLGFHIGLVLYIMNSVLVQPTTRTTAAAATIPELIAPLLSGAQGATQLGSSTSRSATIAHVIAGNQDQVFGLLASQQTWSAYYRYSIELTTCIKHAMQHQNPTQRAASMEEIIRLVAQVRLNASLDVGNLNIVHVLSCLNDPNALRTSESNSAKVHGGPGFVYGQANSTGIWVLLGWYPSIFSDRGLELLKEYPGQLLLSPKVVPDPLLPSKQQLGDMRKQVDALRKSLSVTSVPF